VVVTARPVMLDPATLTGHTVEVERRDERAVIAEDERAVIAEDERAEIGVDDPASA